MQDAFDRLNVTKVQSIIKAENILSMDAAKAIRMHKEEFMAQYDNGKQWHYRIVVKII